MASKLMDAMKRMLGAGPVAPAAAGAGNLGEVALAACDLEQVDTSLLRRLRQGEQLELRALEGRAAACRGERVVGRLPGEESGRVLGLLAGGARLGCRVVLADPTAGLARVRLSVLM